MISNVSMIAELSRQMATVDALSVHVRLRDDKHKAFFALNRAWKELYCARLELQTKPIPENHPTNGKPK